MNEISYRYCHFPPSIVQHAVWLYRRYTLSFRDVEELLAERGIEVSYETIRRWVARFSQRDTTVRGRVDPYGVTHLAPALVEPEAFAVHFEDVIMLDEPVERRDSQLLQPSASVHLSKGMSPVATPSHAGTAT